MQSVLQGESGGHCPGLENFRKDLTPLLVLVLLLLPQVLPSSPHLPVLGWIQGLLPRLWP